MVLWIRAAHFTYKLNHLVWFSLIQFFILTKPLLINDHNQTTSNPSVKHIFGARFPVFFILVLEMSLEVSLFSFFTHLRRSWFSQYRRDYFEIPFMANSKYLQIKRLLQKIIKIKTISICAKWTCDVPLLTNKTVGKVFL